MTKTLKQIIAETGLKQKFIARKIGLHPTYLSQLLNGRRPFRPKDRAALAAFFNMPEEALFFAHTVN